LNFFLKFIFGALDFTLGAHKLPAWGSLLSAIDLHASIIIFENATQGFGLKNIGVQW